MTPIWVAPLDIATACVHGRGIDDPGDLRADALSITVTLV